MKHLAELVPLKPIGDLSERLIRKHGARLGTLSREPFEPSRTKKRVPWDEIVREVQKDTV